MDNPLHEAGRCTMSALVWTLACATSNGESWVSLESYVRGCELVVKAKAVDERDTQITFRVLESWKGKYDPKKFLYATRDGRFPAYKNEHGVVDVYMDQEVIFFFTRRNQPVEGKFANHSTAFPVRKGKVLYAGTDLPEPEGYKREYSLKQFKKTILLIVEREKKRKAKRSPTNR